MVRLTIDLSASPRTADRLVAALRALILSTRGVTGCVDCGVWTAAEDANESVVHYQERWSNEPSMEARVRSDAFTKLLEVVEGARVAPRVEFDFVEKRLGLEYVEAVRGARKC
jgi:quinol monooxygenase YgiN